MKATEFVKKFGLSEFKELYLASLYVDQFRPPNDKIIGIKKSEIKELFEAFELVDQFGGLFSAKVSLNKEGYTGGIECGDDLIDDDQLKKAINLVEKCSA